MCRCLCMCLGCSAAGCPVNGTVEEEEGEERKKATSIIVEE